METRLDRNMEMVNVTVSPVVPNADVVKHNPIGKVPALSVKGMDLFDSPVICEYLDSQHRGRKYKGHPGQSTGSIVAGIRAGASAPQNTVHCKA
jgi:glutathione S-transferase